MPITDAKKLNSSSILSTMLDNQELSLRSFPCSALKNLHKIIFLNWANLYFWLLFFAPSVGCTDLWPPGEPAQCWVWWWGWRCVCCQLWTPGSCCGTSAPVCHPVSAAAPGCPPAAECTDLHRVQNKTKKNKKKGWEWVKRFPSKSRKLHFWLLMQRQQSVLCHSRQSLQIFPVKTPSRKLQMELDQLMTDCCVPAWP